MTNTTASRKTKEEIKSEIAKRYSLRNRITNLAEFISEHALHSDYDKINSLIDEAMENYHNQFASPPTVLVAVKQKIENRIGELKGNDEIMYSSMRQSGIKELQSLLTFIEQQK